MKKFGPFFPEVDEKINQFTYRSLLQRKMFPQMKRDLFNLTMWQKDEAKPHTANTVMEWLDSIFDERMPAIKSRRGDTLAPSSPDLSPLDFFLWGYLKEQVYKPLPFNLEELKARVKREMRELPESLVRKTVLSMKKKAACGSCVRKWGVGGF